MRHTQYSQLIIDPLRKQTLAAVFALGTLHDFTLFKQIRTVGAADNSCLGDSGFQGIQKLHANSCMPKQNSKHHPLEVDNQYYNRALARQRIAVEHVIRRLKVFRLLSERYRNRRKRWGFRFNLIAAIYNLEYTS
jgi:hypothetical protein